MKHFILGILALSAGLQSVNAMEDFNDKNAKSTKISEVLPTTINDRTNIDLILAEQLDNIERHIKNNPQHFTKDRLVNSGSIPVGIDLSCTNEEWLISHSDAFSLGVIITSMLNDRISTLNSDNLLILQKNNNIHSGLSEINLHNTRIISRNVFAYNYLLSNVTIQAHNLGLSILSSAFKNCEIIESFSIEGKIRYIADDAFEGTIIKNMKVNKQQNFDVYQTLNNNGNILHIDWEK